MILPSNHTNGTPAKTLLEDLSMAANSLRQAFRDVENAGPNGRDYYAQGRGVARRSAGAGDAPARGGDGGAA